MDRVISAAEESAVSHSLGLSISYRDTFPETRNHPVCVEVLHKAATELGIPRIEREQGLASSEDAGVLFRIARIGGAMFLLGNGEDSGPLHSYDYDFNEALIAPGISLFARIFANLLF